jgi:hypothetical protein
MTSPPNDALLISLEVFISVSGSIPEAVKKLRGNDLHNPGGRLVRSLKQGLISAIVFLKCLGI